VAFSYLLGTSSVAFPAENTDVTIVLQEEPPSLEPCNANTSVIGKVLKQNVIETLVDRDAGTGVLTPRLATSWDHPDSLTWIFHLRQGVKFHDGADLTADAVIRAVNRTMDTRLDCQVRIGAFNDFKMQLSAVDPLTVKIVTDKPEPILPTRFVLLGIMSPNTSEGIMSNNPIGTGPYQLEKRTPGQEIDLKRFEGYWGDKPVVEHAKFIWRSESAVAAAMVAKGEADLAPNISQDDATTPQDVPYFNSETTRLRIQLDKPPLNDRRVREAINLAIDRDGLRGTVFPKDVQPATQLVPPGTLGYNKDLKVWPYDPGKARQLIAAAKADGVPVDTEFTIYGRLGVYPHSQESLEAVAGMLQEVGLKVKLQMLEIAQHVLYLQKPFPQPIKPNLIQDSHDNANGDAAFTVFYKYGGQGANSVLNDAGLNDVIAKASAATGDERGKLWAEAFKIINSDIIADVPLFHMVGYARVNPRITYRPTIKTNSEVELATINFAK
jgi:peptide/nickel transport system substrate-binding protein